MDNRNFDSGKVITDGVENHFYGQQCLVEVNEFRRTMLTCPHVESNTLSMLSSVLSSWESVGEDLRVSGIHYMGQGPVLSVNCWLIDEKVCAIGLCECVLTIYVYSSL